MNAENATTSKAVFTASGFETSSAFSGFITANADETFLTFGEDLTSIDFDTSGTFVEVLAEKKEKTASAFLTG